MSDPSAVVMHPDAVLGTPHDESGEQATRTRGSWGIKRIKWIKRVGL